MIMNYEADIRIETKRLILRTLRNSDSDEVFRKIANDHDVLKYYVMEYSDSIEGYSINRIVDSFHRSKRYALAIELKKSNEFIGMIHQCSSADPIFQTTEIGYVLGKEYWNKGYMTEALDSFISFLFSKGIHKVFCTHIIENTASGRVMQKCGMIPEEGTRKEELFYNGRYCDLKAYYKINPQ